MRVEAFHPDHVSMMKDFAGQESIVRLIPRDELFMMTREGNPAYSLWDGDVLVACMGAVRASEYRGVAWVMLQTGHTRTFTALTRTAWRLLHALPFKRVETFVKPDDVKAVRWAILCGFGLDRVFYPMWFPDGSGAMQMALYL